MPNAPHIKSRPLPGPKARAWVQRDKAAISTSYTRAYPLVVSHGKGVELTDVDGNAVGRHSEQGLPQVIGDYNARHDLALWSHASAEAPEEWIYVTSEVKATGAFRAARARLVFCGHVHVPALYGADLSGSVREQRIKMGMPVPLISSRRWLAVVGVGWGLGSRDEAAHRSRMPDRARASGGV